MKKIINAIDYVIDRHEWLALVIVGALWIFVSSLT